MVQVSPWFDTIESEIFRAPALPTFPAKQEQQPEPRLSGPFLLTLSHGGLLLKSKPVSAGFAESDCVIYRFLPLKVSDVLAGSVFHGKH